MYRKIEHTIGTLDYCNKTIKFQGQDSEDLFNLSIKRQPENWYYRERPIDYTYNELGHRTISPTQLALSNYILSIGCSFTEGIGIEAEHRYSELIASAFNLKSYNIGLGGSGIDLVSANLSSWLVHYPRPAAVVVQWPQKERKFYHPDPAKQEVHCVGAWILDPEISKSYASTEAANFKALAMSESFDHYYSVIQHIIISMLTVAKIPYVEMYVSGYNEAEIINIDTPYTAYPPLQGDLARDLSHPGILWNQVAATRVIEKLAPQLNQNQ